VLTPAKANSKRPTSNPNGKAKAKSRGRVGNDEARMLRAGLALLNVELLKGGEAKTASVAGTNFYFLTEIRLGYFTSE
jgi:hypothetical protein